MAKLHFISLIILCCFVDFFTMIESDKLAQVHDLIFDEIDNIKRKVWIDLSAEIKSLATKLDEFESEKTVNKCHVKLDKSDQRNDDYITHSDYATLVKGIITEKSISRASEQQLQESLSQISALENELKLLKQQNSELQKEINKTSCQLDKVTEDLKHTNSSIKNLETSDDDIKKDITSLNNSCFKVDEEVDYGFTAPSFVSEWMLMRAQDKEYVQRIVRHGLEVLPYKVEVQIRPTTGPNAGWIFHGDPAFQSDDDYGETYGGIVYLYNETHVILVAPDQSNNENAGVIINTGEANNRRTGNNHQSEIEAYVRCKVWAPSDFPKPDFKTEWLPLDIQNSSLSYYELEHKLLGYPRFINVQIRCKGFNYNVVSEGLGATMMHRKYSNAGGVIYAYNDKSVRLWSGYLESLSDNGHYRLIGWSDGWGNGPINGINIKKGEFRVVAWGSKIATVAKMDTEVIFEPNIVFPEWLSAFNHISLDTDLMTFYVEATDGVNKGYRFRGYGNSQSIESPFGGIVYAFNAAGDIRTWRPNATTDGYLIHVHSPYGNGTNVQASNSGKYVSSRIKMSQ